MGGQQTKVQIRKSKNTRGNLVFLWLRVVDDVRTAIQEHYAYISIPRVTVAN